MTGPLTANDVALQLAKLSRQLDELVQAISTAETQAVNAREDFTLAHAKAFPRAEGPMDVRKHVAIEQTHPQRLAAVPGLGPRREHTYREDPLMAGDTTLTVVGNLTADPELRFTPSGAAVCNFTVASTPRTFDKQSGEWKDGQALFMRCNVWRQAAENVAETLTRGMRVMVTGRLVQRSFEKDGQKRSVVELEVDEVGPSLKYATAKVNRVSRGSDAPQAQAPAADPWSDTSVGEPPF